MSPEVQRVAIARLCGVDHLGIWWRFVVTNPDGDSTDVCHFPTEAKALKEREETWTTHGWTATMPRPYPVPERLPDYLNDLNDAHSAETAILGNDGDAWDSYYALLDQVVEEMDAGDSRSAPAAARSKALLLHMELWE